MPLSCVLIYPDRQANQFRLKNPQMKEASFEWHR